ncbi:MAG: hypothetical protein QM831_19165 [Kofleriaceae bacterium]
MRILIAMLKGFVGVLVMVGVASAQQVPAPTNLPAPDPDADPPIAPRAEPAAPDPKPLPPPSRDPAVSGPTTSLAPGAAPYAPMVAPLPPSIIEKPDPHRGFTFEIGLGVGWLHVDAGLADNYTTRAALAPASLSIGGFLTKHVALVGRIAGSEGRQNENEPYSINGFYGPAVQYWFTPEVWVMGGLGFGLFGAADGVTRTGGYAADLRVGYTFFTWFRQSANVAFEVVPAHYTVSDEHTEFSYTVTSFALTLDYQFL